MAYILLVDDNPQLLEVYGSLLRGAGHHVVTASNGKDAVDWLLDRAEGLPELVLLDMEMPLMDGVEAARRMREEPGLSGLTILALTSHELPDNVTEGLAAGCDGYIVKPARAADLLTELQLFFAGE